MAEYGIRWTECNRRGEHTTKERVFTTEKARDTYVARLENRPSFVAFVAYLNPRDADAEVR